MVFSYFTRLTKEQKLIYQKSDAIHFVYLPNAAELHPIASELVSVLEAGDRLRTEKLCSELSFGICLGLKAPRVRVRVLAVRPSAAWGELHGLYIPAQGKAASWITVWMRTARRRQVVAFRSFLRTVLHEICHHLDYELFKLEQSFHTEGFYKRESSLFHQLTDDARAQEKVFDSQN